MQPRDERPAETRPLLELEGIGFDYARAPKPGRRTLNGVSFTVPKGQALGLIGQSGSGKSTIAKIVLGLAKPSEGVIRFDGKPIDEHGLQSFRRRVQPIFQDPMDALDPRMRIGDQLREPLLVNFRLSRSEQMERVVAALASVGLPREIADKRPRQISGGQAQRATIARALLLDPELLICDEPVSALDMTVQAQILNLLNDLRAKRGLTLLFISHDIRAISYLCSEIVVLHKGCVVETGSRESVLLQSFDEYTRTLIASVPSKGRRALSGRGQDEDDASFKAERAASL
ncbi:dipeptide/oligopeptide/nickel ABC transporter ATP-binding protein [Rhizobium sp. BK068]|uniref:ABC transporter ATP-binding protein n=1 Tax=Rhizobium sp. BK068 TaxID=2512130 RepID=UPI00104BA6C5|nr:dipeptide/oligopeptide/nickel ABC transporter ATP-binding protein [Rhizobium sp. BK068]TCM76722.1 ABC transporter family protein [Rhizobium sp. BK068]